jgi:hypothetical protein
LMASSWVFARQTTTLGLSTAARGAAVGLVQVRRDAEDRSAILGCWAWIE